MPFRLVSAAYICGRGITDPKASGRSETIRVNPWLNKFSAYKKLASITLGYLDTETMNIVDTQMYIDGYQVKLVSDTSCGSLWEVSFTLKEF